MRTALSSARLYGILDLGYVTPEELTSVAAKMVAGGIDIMQLRAKGHAQKDIEKWGREVLPICRDRGVPFIINDHPEIAATIEADGVHVGQDDLPMDEVRTIVGSEMLVGRSTHSIQQAARAASDSRTDCIGFGPLFATPTKPEYTPIGIKEIRKVHQNHPDLPIFCIGGIKKENLHEVLAAGARRAVIVSGILQAEDIEKYVRESKGIMEKYITQERS